MRALLLAITLLASGSALAKKPADFVAPRELTPEEIEAEKRRSRSSLGGYNSDVPPQESAVPWRALGLMGIVFIVATPFAWRAYKSTAKEISQTGPGASPPRNLDDRG